MRADAGLRAGEAAVAALRERFPPRLAAAAWDFTGQDRTAVLARLLSPPFALDNSSSQSYRKFGLIRVLDWLAAQPGRTWQDRWNASGAGSDGHADWRPRVARWLRDTGRIAQDNAGAERQLSVGMMQLVCADVIRPGMGWLLTTATPRNLSGEMARVRDPAGFSKLSELGSASLDDDGLVGYFLDSDPGQLSSPYGPSASGYVTASPVSVTIGQPTTLTLLLHPQGLVHAFTGILPPASAALPPAFQLAPMHATEVTFRSGPLLSPPTALTAPLPAFGPGDWAWLQYDPSGAAAQPRPGP